METNFNLNLEYIPKELKIILELIKSDNVRSVLPLLRDINWNHFLDLAMHHRLYPLLAGKLNKVDKGLIPSYVAENIEFAFKKNTFNMLRLSADLEKICKLFNENDIPVLALKGPILGDDLYGDISLRTSGDIDVLVPIAQLAKVEEVLVNQGFVKDDYIKTILNDWKWRHHHVTYYHPDKIIKIEIHWRLNPGPSKEPGFQELWKRKRKSSLTNYPVYYLSREDLFLFLVSHGARHGWSRLRWLVDIKQIVKQKIDWILLLRLLKKYHYQDVSGQAIILISELLNAPIIKESQPLLNCKANKLAQAAVFYLEKMVNLHNEPVPEDVSAYHKRHLFQLMSKIQKVIFIMSFLYPYPEDAEALPLPKRLHFLYFPLRPFLWAWRRTKYHALS
jgi:hypothetical protein